MDGVMGIFDPSNTGTHIPEEIYFSFTHLQGQEINLKCRGKKRKYKIFTLEQGKKEQRICIQDTEKNRSIQSQILLKSLILAVKMHMCYLLHYIWWEDHYFHESRISEYKNYSLMYMD